MTATTKSGWWCHVPPPPPEVELLPHGISVHEFARKVVAWAGLSGPDMLDRAKN